MLKNSNSLETVQLRDKASNYMHCSYKKPCNKFSRFGRRWTWSHLQLYIK